MSTAWPEPKRRRVGTGGKRGVRAMKQMTFAERPLVGGGKRQKLGRKPGPRPNVRHRARPEHAARIPLHLTMRALPGLPSFRSERLRGAFEDAFRRTRRPDFQIVEYSIQDNHLHLIVEADSQRCAGARHELLGTREPTVQRRATARSWARVG